MCLKIKKIRNKSKADESGLRENDTILYINDVPTSNLNLQAATDLIDESENLCLVVSSKLPTTTNDSQSLSSNQTRKQQIESAIVNSSPAPVVVDDSIDPESELIDEFRYKAIYL